jgi:hypothetical protein
VWTTEVNALESGPNELETVAGPRPLDETEPNTVHVLPPFPVSVIPPEQLIRYINSGT